MKLKKGDVVKKRRGGGTKRCEVVRVTKTHATLKPLAASAQGRVGRSAHRTVPRDERGLPEGYEVAT